MTIDTLKAYTKTFRKSSSLQGNFGDIPKSQPEEISVNLRLDLAKRLIQLKKRSDFNELLDRFLSTIENENKPEAKESDSRHIPTNIKKYVLSKYGNHCAFPGCHKTYKILHHTQRFALNKMHDPDHIVPLCIAHERLAHLSLIENEEEPPHTWQLRRNPDKSASKYHIDQKVGSFRRQSSSQAPRAP